MSNEMTVSPDFIFLQNKNAARVTGWLGNVFHDPAAQGAGIELAIYNISGEGESRLLRKFTLDGVPEPGQCAELVREIEAAAMDDASQLRGAKQHYMLSGSAGRGHDLGSLPLTYMPLNAGWADADAAQPTERGLVELCMKQLQAMHVLFMQTVGPQNESNARRLAQQDATIDRLNERASKFADEKEALATKRFERDLALETARKTQDLESLQALADMQKSEQYQKFIFDKLGPLVSIAGNRFAGGKPTPGSPSPMDLMVSALSSHLTTEEVAGISRVVRPEIAALLREILTTGTPSAPSAAPASPAAPPGSSTAPADAPPVAAAPTITTDPFGPLPAATVSAALEFIRKELLPWMASPLSAGKDVITEKPMAIIMLTRLMQGMTPEQYETLTTSDPRLSAAERQALAALLSKLELGPCLPSEAKKNS